MNRIFSKWDRVVRPAAARIRAGLFERGGLVYAAVITGLVGASLLASPHANAASCGGCGPSESTANQPDGHAGHDGHVRHDDSRNAQNATHVGNRTVTPPAIASILGEYTKIHSALAADNISGIHEAATTIAKSTSNGLPPQLVEAAKSLAGESDLTASREAFKGLSASLSRYLGEQKVQTGRYFQMYCSMANAGWIQADKAVKNPYFGKSMLSCGEVMGNY